MFADEYTVSVSDEHIALFTVDGSKVSGTSATLDPENGIKEFTLKAEDEAGNTASMSIILMATWLKDKIIPAMNKLREYCDEMEINTASDVWPFPTYGDILFSV